MYSFYKMYSLVKTGKRLLSIFYMIRKNLVKKDIMT